MRVLRVCRCARLAALAVQGQNQLLARTLNTSLNDSPFALLGLSAGLVRAVTDEGYTTPTTVQAEAIPAVLAGRDVLASAQTGTGKTAAFVLPLLERMAKEPRTSPAIRALVLTPTRELAVQIDQRVQAYGRHFGVRSTVIYGGVSQYKQEGALRRNPDMVIATPGRLLDLMRQGIVRLEGVKYLVLDEADRMLDMGFAPDLKTVCSIIPKSRQTLLFSATMPAGVAGLARAMLTDPVNVSVRPAETTSNNVKQSVMYVSRLDKRVKLIEMLENKDVKRAIVFTATKHGAQKLSDLLEKNRIRSSAIHGNKTQGARQKALNDFRFGNIRVLVATDVAARGIDVDGITHVFNYDLPNTPDSYVHRIGRTGRAGAVGEAIAFVDPENERGLLRDVERFIKTKLEVVGDVPDVVREEEARQQSRGGKNAGAPRAQRPPPRAARQPDYNEPGPFETYQERGGPRRPSARPLPSGGRPVDPNAWKNDRPASPNPGAPQRGPARGQPPRPLPVSAGGDPYARPRPAAARGPQSGGKGGPAPRGGQGGHGGAPARGGNEGGGDSRDSRYRGSPRGGR